MTLVADTQVTPSSSELVTFGLPIAKGVLNDTDEVRVAINGVEQPICITQSMTWWQDNSVRAIRVQLQGVNMTGGSVIVSVSDQGRNTARDFNCKPLYDGWTQAGAEKSQEMYPRVFALHDRTYLTESGVTPPFSAAPATPDAFEKYLNTQHSSWSGALNFDDSSSANWLFDRSSAYFKAYLSTTNVEFLKEAILSKQYYFQFVRKDGNDPAPPGGRGCWERTGINCADGKFIAPQQAKLALMLAGDDSQWDNDLINDMARQADIGWYQPHCSRGAPTDQNFYMTERACGLNGLSLLVAYEMTGDADVLAKMNETIAFLKSVQQTEFSWDVNNNWLPKSGAFTHDIDVHEGNESQTSAPDDYTDAQGFSPWMSENIADFLWQAYWVTGNQDIPQMLRMLGNAIELYAFTSSYNATSGNFERKPEYGDSRALFCNTERQVTELLYFASAYVSDERKVTGDWWSWYTDLHNIEVVLPLATAYYFETNSAVKRRLKARIEKILAGMLNQNCAQRGNTKRAFNWQHRSNSVRTWYWINEQ